MDTPSRFVCAKIRCWLSYRCRCCGHSDCWLRRQRFICNEWIP